VLCCSGLGLTRSTIFRQVDRRYALGLDGDLLNIWNSQNPRAIAGAAGPALVHRLEEWTAGVEL
jgi:hypothetical protein